MKRLLWGRAARRHLDEIAQFYASIDPDLPDRLLSRVEAAPLALLDFPRMGRITERPGVRRWLAKGTPFVLLYRVVGDEVRVIAVVHERTGLS